MRIVTWNINGLRAVCKRGIGDIATLLDSIQADIICFQETKLIKAELDRDLALVEGWDSYFSHCKDRSYSGVATYCKKAVTVPVAAEQGITGILHDGKLDAANAARQIPGCLDELCNRFTQQELRAIDLEGRCVITDHEAFILFNLYGPAITSEENAAERFAYKMQLYQALQCRVEACLAAGRAVILVGDLNICPQPSDSCDPGDVSKFRDRADKKWLSAVMKHNGGYFVDLFRHFYPARQEVYSCWSTASGARVNNYGARIDLILLAEPAIAGQADVAQYVDKPDVSSNTAFPVLASTQQQQSRGVEAGEPGKSLLEQCTDCDVQMDVQGSDHAPVHADWDLLAPLPIPETAPPLSTRYMFTGKQRKLTAWLGGPGSGEHVHLQLTEAPQPPLPDLNEPHQSCVTKLSSSSSCTDPPSTAEPTAQGIAHSAPSGVPRSSAGFSRKGSGSKAGARGGKAGQTNLRTFLQLRPAAVTTTTVATSAKADASSTTAAMSSTDMIQTATPAASGASPGTALPVTEFPVTAMSHDPQLSARSAEVKAAVPEASLDPVLPQQAGADLQHAEAADRPTSNGPGVGYEAGPLQGISFPSTPSHSQAEAADPSSRSAQPSQDDVFGSQCNSAADASKAAVTAAWSKIQNKMKAPKCKGHGEDCVIREVKKNGPNKGRLFYVCRRPDGKPPQGRCDHFEWVGSRTTRGQPVQSAAVTASNKRLKQA
ncbi:hypothetical protein WJX77_012431 [Trebouxia sp. C0004]